MKVQRLRKIDTTSDTHTIQLTLTAADVKNMFLKIKDLLNNSVGVSYSPIFLPKDIEYSVTHYFSYLGSYADNLVEWAFAIAIKEGFILQSSQVGYKINPQIMAMRPGRTSKKVQKILDD